LFTSIIGLINLVSAVHISSYTSWYIALKSTFCSSLSIHWNESKLVFRKFAEFLCHTYIFVFICKPWCNCNHTVQIIHYENIFRRFTCARHTIFTKQQLVGLSISPLSFEQILCKEFFFSYYRTF
jgi:hypothetical protein